MTIFLIWLICIFYTFNINANDFIDCKRFARATREAYSNIFLVCIDDDEHPHIILEKTAFGPRYMNSFYHNAHLMPQIPYEFKDKEEVYYLLPFFKEGGILRQDALCFAKIVFSKPDDDDAIEDVQIEGFYSNRKEPWKPIGAAASGSLGQKYDDGNMKWHKVDGMKCKRGTLDIQKDEGSGAITWKLEGNDKVQFNQYIQKLETIASHQTSRTPVVWEVDRSHYVYHPDVARGAIKWVIAYIIPPPHGTGRDKVSIPSLPKGYHGSIEIASESFLEYTFIDKDLLNDYDNSWESDGKYTLKFIIPKERNALKLEVINSELFPVDDTSIFWEPQWSGHCWRHSFNAIFGEEKYPKCIASAIPRMETHKKMFESDPASETLSSPALLGTALKGEQPQFLTFLPGYVVLAVDPWWKIRKRIGKQIRGRRKRIDERKRTRAHYQQWITDLLLNDFEEMIGIFIDTEGHVSYIKRLQPTLKTRGDFKHGFFEYYMNLDSGSYEGPSALKGIDDLNQVLKFLDDPVLEEEIEQGAFELFVMFKKGSKETVIKEKLNEKLGELPPYAKFLSSADRISFDEELRHLHAVEYRAGHTFIPGSLTIYHGYHAPLTPPERRHSLSSRTSGTSRTETERRHTISSRTSGSNILYTEQTHFPHGQGQKHNVRILQRPPRAMIYPPNHSASNDYEAIVPMLVVSVLLLCMMYWLACFCWSAFTVINWRKQKKNRIDEYASEQEELCCV